MILIALYPLHRITMNTRLACMTLFNALSWMLLLWTYDHISGSRAASCSIHCIYSEIAVAWWSSVYNNSKWSPPEERSSRTSNEIIEREEAELQAHSTTVSRTPHFFTKGFNTGKSRLRRWDRCAKIGTPPSFLSSTDAAPFLRALLDDWASILI